LKVHSIPEAIWKTISRTVEGVDTIFPLQPPLTPDAFRALGAKLFYSSSKAKEELGYQPESAAAVVGRTLKGLGFPVMASEEIAGLN
jgi:hypothetical protein